MAEGFRQIGDHRKGCFANGDSRAFVSHVAVFFGRNKRGYGTGSTMWHRFACNDPKCQAEMLVRWDVMADFVTTEGRFYSDAGEALAAAIEQAQAMEEWGDDFEAAIVDALGAYREATGSLTHA